MKEDPWVRVLFHFAKIILFLSEDDSGTDTVAAIEEFG